MRAVLAFRKPVVLATIGAMLALAWPVPTVQAELVPTERVVEKASDTPRDRLRAFLARGDVQAQLEALGVPPAQAQGRLDALSDVEVQKIAGKIDSLPAGEGVLGTILGAAVVIFVVLLITDILGFTDVFGFTNRGSATTN